GVGGEQRDHRCPLSRLPKAGGLPTAIEQSLLAGDELLHAGDYLAGARMSRRLEELQRPASHIERTLRDVAVARLDVRPGERKCLLRKRSSEQVLGVGARGPGVGVLEGNLEDARRLFPLLIP